MQDANPWERGTIEKNKQSIGELWNFKQPNYIYYYIFGNRKKIFKRQWLKFFQIWLKKKKEIRFRNLNEPQAQKKRRKERGKDHTIIKII